MMLCRWAAALLLVSALPIAAQEPAEQPAAPPAPTALAEPSAASAQPLSTKAADLVVDSAGPRPELIPTGQFAERSAFRGVKLSPDGANFAFVHDFSLRAALVVASPDSEEAGENYFLPDGFNANYFRWAGNQRLLVSGVGTHRKGRYIYRVRRWFVVDLVSGQTRRLIDDPFVSSYSEILGVSEDGSYAMIAHSEKPRDYDENKPAVFRYELTGDFGIWLAQPWLRGITDWTIDEQGQVRLGMGLDGDRLKIWYRADPEGELQQIREIDVDDPEAIGSAMRMTSGSSEAYVLRSVDGAKVGLHRYDYLTGEVVETLYENADWDLQDVWFRDGEPLAVAYTDHARRIVWLNEEDRVLYDQLHAALGGGNLRLVVTSRSEDNNRMLIWAGDEADPGVLYLFDRLKRDLKVLAALRPELDFEQLARPQPITYTARDGTPIPSYLTLPRGREPRGLPLIIMPHGGPFGIRDTLAYNDEVQLLANRGYAVLQPNFRGSGGYGDAFYELGEGEVGRGMQDDLDDAMDWAVREGLADPARVCVVGGSYGGYAALWAVTRNPDRYVCAASWAGVTDFDRILRYDRKFLSREGRRRWRQKIEGEEDFNLRNVSPMRFGASLNRPVLLAHGTRDVVVPFSQFDDMVEATEEAPMPPTVLIIQGAGHSFSRKRDEQMWYNALDAFLAEHNPADQLDPSGQWVSPIDPREAQRGVRLEIASPTGEPTEQGEEP